jgi:class 3 adenylate cyclase/tetratricopeptide (TPR) repeat protein
MLGHWLSCCGQYDRGGIVSSSLDSLTGYVSDRVLRHCATGTSEQLAPAEESFHGAVMFCDISGFTDLTQRHVDKGPEGLEELTGILNPYFRNLFLLVREHGGDVLKVAGDGVLVVWEVLADPAEAVHRAVQCAQAIQAVDPRLSQNSKLLARIGIGSGTLKFFYLGGLTNRWEMLPAGELLTRTGYAQDRAKPGEIVLSPEAWRLLCTVADGVELDSGFFRLVDLTKHILPQLAPVIDPNRISSAKLERFVPVAARFLMHEAGEKWLAELRSLTMLFVNFPDPAQIQLQLDSLQQLTTSLQKVIHRFEGSLKQLNFDEKGVSFVVAFGLPPLSHEDDAYRAVQAARTIKEAWSNLGFRLNLGVASGRVFCGSVGGEHRHEYAILGSVINLASRLSGKAENDILCDQPTFQASAARIQFAALPPMRLKGIARPMPAYRPVSSIAVVASGSRLVGHGQEWQQLEQVPAKLKRGETFLGMIEGDPGIGKSTLIRQWSRAASAAGIRVLSGAAESVHSTTPYFVWRPILESLLSLPAATRVEEQRETFAAVCRGKNWESLSPLLEDVLELGIPDNAITAQMTGKSRADSTRELVTGLLAAHSQQKPIAIVLEDCHWMDSASLALALQVAERIAPGAIILTSRPLRTDGTDAISELLKRQNLIRFHLQTLSNDDCVALVAEKLSVRKIAKPVADLIVSKSQGNPFFSVEIAFALREHGLVLIEGDQCKPVSGVDLATVRLPENIEGLIAQRVDALEREIQLVAKVASVIGMNFSVSLLRSVYPIADARPKVPQFLEVLASERLIQIDENNDFAFGHALVRDAVYDRLLGSQKQNLHALVGAELEQRHASDLESISPLLGYHWKKGGDLEKAAGFFGLAGQRAVLNGAYQEGLGFLDDALAHSAQPQNSRGRWRRFRAEALLGLGRLGESSQEFRQAAEALGRPALEGKINRRLRQQVTARISLHLRGSKPAAVAAREQLRELAAIYEMLSLLDLFANRMPSSLSAALDALECAEQLGDSAEYARSLATMSLACSLVPMRWLADRYAQRAVSVAERLGEESTKARVFELTAMYLLGEGRWQITEERFEQAIDGFKLVGDRRREIECTCLLSTFQHYRGNFVERVRLGQRVFQLAQASGDLQAQAWGLLDQIESLLHLGDFDQVETLGAALRSHLGQNIYGADEIMAYGLLAALELRVGRFDGAVGYADKALAVMMAVTPTLVYNLEAYAAVADVYLTGCTLAPAGARNDFAVKAKQAGESLRGFARVFRVARPRSKLISAREKQLAGDVEAALRESRESLQLAKQLGMPYEQALAHRQIAALLPQRDGRRSNELEHALQLFERLSTRYDLGLTAALKAGISPAVTAESN